MQKEAEVILKVNSKQAEEKFRTLEEKAKSLRSKLADAFRSGDTRGIDDINKELKKVNREIDRMRTNAANIKAAMVRLDQASPKELKRTIRLINDELNSGRVARGSEEWSAYIAKLKEVKAELAEVNAEMRADDKEESMLDKIKDGLGNWGLSAATGAAAITGIVVAGKKALQAYADMEAEEANVRKFTGMTAEEVAALNEEFKKIDTRTPREELNKLAQEAGRLGKTAPEDVLGFVKAGDQINVALDDLGENAVLTLSKLTGIFGDEAKYGTEQSLLKVGSVINDLSQNCSASAPYLAEFSSRLGGIAAQSKMSISQVMAFGAVLDTNNLNVEASATAVGQLITAIYKEPAKIAKAAGMDVTKFSQMVKTDMNGALIALFEQLNKFGGMQNLATVFDSMGTDGARAIPVFTALAGHIGDLKAQQEAASEAFREGTSVSKEAAIQNNTVQAQLDKAKNNLHELVVSLGEKLWPVMNLCISGTSMLMRVLSDLVSFIANNKGIILTLIATLVTYTAVAKASALATKAWNVATAAGNGIATAFKVSILALRIAYYELTSQTLKANAAQRLFAQTTKANPLGLLMSAAVAVIGTLITMTQSFNDSRKAAQEAAKEYEDWKESITNVDAASGEYSAKELTRLDLLYKAATDEKKSKDERKKAVQQLQNLYPDYFKNLNIESLSVDNLTKDYLRLRDSILAAARARAAADLIYENQKQILQLQGERNDAFEDRKNASAQRDQIRARNKGKDNRASASSSTLTGSIAMSAGGSAELYAHESTAEADRAVYWATTKMNEATKKINELNKANQELVREYSRSTAFQDQMGLNGNSGTLADAGSVPVRGETDQDRKAREKAAREARKAERDAQREAKEALKKDLDDRKSLYLQAEAENLMLYVTGRQTYADYLAQKENLDREYADDVIKIHENHNKLDIAAYGQALKTKADMLRKQQESRRRYSLSYLEKEHEGNTDSITSDYYDPSAREFQNKTILTQRLLQEDLRYITEKKKLYSEGSEEWAALEREYNDRIRQDQLDKMKETAEAVKWYKENFTKESATLQRETELAMLEQLHARGLISEKDYQEAVKKLKEKYRDEDLENAQGIKSEFVDILKDMSEAFAGLLEGFNWDDLTKLVENACALMSAAVSQYTAYANAERDLELAKIEKRYDKEIAAAGKNSKKKKKLEEQKEAEVAKVKKKYNDRAMKVEIAQAIAQTALAAIAAYASGSKVNVWLGPVAAALALAAGAVQIATIKKQHEAEAAGYYEGGFTRRDPDNRREAGVVHANEFVANHQAVANPALSPVLRLIDTAQRNNTVGSLTAADVSNALGQGAGVSARGAAAMGGTLDSVVAGGLALAGEGAIRSAEAIDRLNDTIADGIEAKVILDGEDGFHKKYQHFQKLQNNPKR